MTMAADKQDKVLNFSSKREQSGTCSSSAEHEKNQGKNFLNVPTLRFPEFSGEWKKYKLGDIMEFTKERISSSLLTEDNYVSTENMLQDFQGITHAHNVPEDTNVMEYKQGDVLVSNIRPYLKKIWMADKDGGCSADVFVMRANRNVCTDDFLHHIVANDRFIGYVMSGAKGVKMPRGDKEQMKGYETALPSLIEQQKVAHLLAIIDERIITQIRIIEGLKSLSDVICERLYNPSEKESWQTYKYADLFSISNERNGKLQYSNVLSASQEYGMIERNELNIDIKFEASSIINYKIVRPNQYVIHLRSFQGGFAYSDKTGVCSPAYTILVPNEKLSTAFLKYYFTSQKFINSLRIVTYGIRDGRSISVEEFLQLKVAIPDIAHQQHIVRVMRLWEEKIWIEESYLTKLQQQKQFLLTTMFV